MIVLDYTGKTIRLTEERWKHINERHPETVGEKKLITETMKFPDLIQEGKHGELLAIKKFERTPISDNKYCVVVYKHDGVADFIVTAYFTRRPSSRRKTIWKK